MRAFRRFAALASALLFALVLAAAPSLAQSWPQRTVRLIVPLPPGTGTDIAARMLAERLAERWGQPVVVENRQGADGIPAVTTFLAARDTHMLLLSFAGIITVNPLVHERLPYDPVKDLVPIVPVADNFLGVSASATLKVGVACRSGQSRAGAAGQAQLGGHAGSALLHPAGAAEERGDRHDAGVLSRFRTGRSGSEPGTACTSQPPACRCWCRIIAPARPSCCS